MEIILYDVVLPKLVCVQINFVKIVSILFVVVIKPLIYIDINPRISLVSVVKKAKQIFIWLKKILIFSQIG